MAGARCAIHGRSDTAEARSVLASLPGEGHQLICGELDDPETCDAELMSTGASVRDERGGHDPLRSIILPRTRISNLLFTGQNLNLHGVLGVTASAVITCSELLGLEYLSKKIAHG